MHLYLKAILLSTGKMSGGPCGWQRKVDPSGRWPLSNSWRKWGLSVLQPQQLNVTNSNAVWKQTLPQTSDEVLCYGVVG